MAPWSSVAVDRKGNIFGTTDLGGDPSCVCGVVFKISSKGKETVLHTFEGGQDGARPIANVVLGRSGTLYGTTTEGGADDYGTVFQVTADGTETVLHSFHGSDGISPEADLMIGKDGNLYSTTAFGGANGDGEVFKLTPAGELTVLYSFKGSGMGD